MSRMSSRMPRWSSRRRAGRDAGGESSQARRPETRRAETREPTRLFVVSKQRELAGIGERHQRIYIRAKPIARSRIVAFVSVGVGLAVPAARDFQGDQRASGGLLALQPQRSPAFLVGREHQQLVALPEHYGHLGGRAEPPAHRVCHDGRRHQRRGDESGGFRGVGCVLVVVRVGIRRTVARVCGVAARNRHDAPFARLARTAHK